MSLLLFLAAAALQGTGAATGESQSITREQAMILAPREIGRIVLGQVGDLVREVSRPTNQGVPYPDERLQSLAFGLAPEASAPGLCTATAIYVSFASEAPGLEGGGRAAWQLPVRASNVATRWVYKVVGDLEADTPFGPDERAAQLARCLNAQVVPTETLDFDQPRYFSVEGSLASTQAAGIMQIMLTDVAADNLSDLHCDPDSAHFAPCTDPRLALRNLTLDDLKSVGSVLAGPGRYVLSAIFRDPANPDRQMELEVRAEVELAEPSRRLLRFRTVTVKRSAIIF